MQFSGYIVDGKREDKSIKTASEVVRDSESKVFPFAKSGRYV